MLLLGTVFICNQGFASEESITIEDITNDRGVKGLRGSFQLAASREAIWDLLTDYERFTETFTGIRRLKVISEDESGAQVRFTIKASIFTFEYTLRRDYVRPFELITWRRTGGAFRHISGSWMILPGSREGVQQIIYESFVDVGFLIPTALVRDRAAKELEKTIERMRDRLAVS